MLKTKCFQQCTWRSHGSVSCFHSAWAQQSRGPRLPASHHPTTPSPVPTLGTIVAPCASRTGPPRVLRSAPHNGSSTSPRAGQKASPRGAAAQPPSRPPPGQHAAAGSRTHLSPASLSAARRWLRSAARFSRAGGGEARRPLLNRQSHGGGRPPPGRAEAQAVPRRAGGKPWTPREAPGA